MSPHLAAVRVVLSITGYHKPHLPHIVPKAYFDLYDINKVSLPPNGLVPKGFQDDNWHANGNIEMYGYSWNVPQRWDAANFSFSNPISVGDPAFTRAMRRAYFAATSFVDAQIGKVLTALEANGFKENTIVTLWSDHGWHLGDTNSWCKETNFETAARNTLLWRVPGQKGASKGLNTRLVEMLDLFPTIVELTGLPALPQCEGIDQPPTTLCVQGSSYASEFLPSHNSSEQASPAKGYAFTQWPHYNYNPQTNSSFNNGTYSFRMSYTVRSATGYRFTQYVPYDPIHTHRGNWSACDTEYFGACEIEL
jgi:iduronate 2-sulfatase